MKLFDSQFFSGTLLVGLGLISAAIGGLLLLPPFDYAFVGIILVPGGVSLIIFGRKLAKVSLPAPSKTAVKTLGRAGMLDKKRKP